MTHAHRDSASPLHRAALHESGYLHASGAALYVDDLPEPVGLLHARPVVSSRAHARVVSIDPAQALAMPGVRAVLTARDIPGVNDISPVAHDEELLASDEVHCQGQPVAVVVADSFERARDAAKVVTVEYEDLPAIVDLAEAIEKESFSCPPHVIARGDVAKAIAQAELVVEGEVRSGGQDHFYLETQAALALLTERGDLYIHSSTQHPSEVQAKVAEVLGLGSHQVVVECPRMGGGFGGKETQAALPAALAALAAQRLGAPVKVRYDRDFDMAYTGKRHPWLSRYRAAFTREGDLRGLEVFTYSDGGFSLDLSKAVLQRCLFHLDNAYFIEHVRFEGRVARTNLPSNTAFRGFGGPQGTLVVEEVINAAAEMLQLDPAEVRRRNYYGEAPRNIAPYGQEITHNRMQRIHTQLLASSDYEARRAEIERSNPTSRFVKRGIGFAPVKFGISFTTAMLNQAGALVLVYADGTVQLNHGGTEMGQGLHTKMLAVCAHELGVPVERIRVMNTSTDKVPNTSATAASSGSDLNGAAIRDACQTLKNRLRPVAAELIDAADPGAIRFEGGRVYDAAHPERSAAFEQVTQKAWTDQISLAATGYYRTPGIHFDTERGRGTPFYYYAYGGAVVEVELNGLTGEHRMTRVDILHDVGSSLVPSIDIGQIEGGFIQGVGWLTCEELKLDDTGRLLTHGPSTYKVPAVGEAPLHFRVALLDEAPQPGVIGGSKAVGEPPFMLAIGTITALRHALSSFAPVGAAIGLGLPATPEAILRAAETLRSTTGASGSAAAQ